MSDSDGSSTLLQEFIEQLPFIVIAGRGTLAATFLFGYDWLITISTEVQEIWMSKITGASLLYLITRYGSIVAWVASQLLFSLPGSLISCRGISYLYEVANIMVTITTLGIFVLRTWAIYQKNIYILLGLGSLAIVRIGFALAFSFWGSIPDYASSPAPILFGGCGSDTKPWLESSYTAYISMSLAFSTLIFFLTLLRTLHAARQAKAAGIKNSLYYYLLRDGTVYYLTIAILNVINLVIRQDTAVDQPSAVIIPYLSSSLDSILTCRLVLNLRQVSRESVDEKGNATLHIDSMPDAMFATGIVLGNLGAPLRDNFDEPDLNFDLEESATTTENETSSENNTDKELEQTSSGEV